MCVRTATPLLTLLVSDLLRLPLSVWCYHVLDLTPLLSVMLQRFAQDRVFRRASHGRAVPTPPDRLCGLLVVVDYLLVISV